MIRSLLENTSFYLRGRTDNFHKGIVLTSASPSNYFLQTKCISLTFMNFNFKQTIVPLTLATVLVDFAGIGTLLCNTFAYPGSCLSMLEATLGTVCV